MILSALACAPVLAVSLPRSLTHSITLSLSLSDQPTNASTHSLTHSPTHPLGFIVVFCSPHYQSATIPNACPITPRHIHCLLSPIHGLRTASHASPCVWNATPVPAPLTDTVGIHPSIPGPGEFSREKNRGIANVSSNCKKAGNMF